MCFKRSANQAFSRVVPFGNWLPSLLQVSVSFLRSILLPCSSSVSRPTMQCNGPAGCSRLLPEAKVAPTHRSADRRRWAP